MTVLTEDQTTSELFRYPASMKNPITSTCWSLDAIGTAKTCRTAMNFHGSLRIAMMPASRPCSRGLRRARRCTPAEEARARAVEGWLAVW